MCSKREFKNKKLTGHFGLSIFQPKLRDATFLRTEIWPQIINYDNELVANTTMVMVLKRYHFKCQITNN